MIMKLRKFLRKFISHVLGIFLRQVGTILGHPPTRRKFLPTDSANNAEQWEAQVHVLRNQVFRNVRVGVIYHHARVCFSAPPRSLVNVKFRIGMETRILISSVGCGAGSSSTREMRRIQN